MPQRDRDPVALAQLVDKLDKLGFYRFTPAELVPLAKANTLQGGYPFAYYDPDEEDLSIDDDDNREPVEHIKRLWPGDEKRLAKGGVVDLFEELTPLLDLLHVQINQLLQEVAGQEPYTISVNYQKYRMYSAEELEHSDIWGLTGKRSLAVLNSLLEQVGTDERFYQIGGGHDGFIVLLTPAMNEALRIALPYSEQDMPQPIDPRIADTIRELST